MATTQVQILTPATLPKMKQRHKKHDDPFYSTPLNQPISRPPSPEHDAQNTVPSRLKSILLTPILFTSFLLSLFLVNRGDRAARASSNSRPHRHGGLLGYLSPRVWLAPEPYQDPDSTAWDTAIPSSDTPDPVISQTHGARKSSWFVRKKHRAIARLQVADAFELRGWVIVAMVGFGLTIFLGLVWGLRRLFR